MLFSVKENLKELCSDQTFGRSTFRVFQLRLGSDRPRTNLPRSERCLNEPFKHLLLPRKLARHAEPANAGWNLWFHVIPDSRLRWVKFSIKSVRLREIHVLKSLSSNYSSSNCFFQTALLARNGRNHLTAKPRAAIALGWTQKERGGKFSHWVMAHERCRFLSSKWCCPQMEDPQSIYKIL